MGSLAHGSQAPSTREVALINNRASYWPSFILVSLASLVFFTSLNMLLPTIPIYAGQLGGSELEVGFTVGVLALTACASRPFVGVRIDHGRRLSLLFVGTLVSCAACVAYAFSGSVWQLIALRGLHGVGIAAFATAASTLIADLAPPERRGEMVGLYGLTMSIGLSIGPPLGIAAMDRLGFPFLFTIASAFYILSLALTAAVKEPSQGRSRLDAPGKLINFDALPASLMILLIGITYGPIASFLPMFATSRGMDNPGLFFTANAVTILLVRVWTGKLSDTFGRTALIVPGILAMALGIEILAMATDSGGLLLAGAVYGLGGGALYPAAMALAIDRTRSTERGSAMATYTAAWDLGMAGGAGAMGLLLRWIDMSLMFNFCGLIAMLALGTFIYSERFQKRRLRDL